MTTRESAENPFLQGNFGPWRLEGQAPDVEVVGELVGGLHGAGANVVLHCHRSRAEADRLADELNDARPRSCVVVQADLLEVERGSDGRVVARDGSLVACSPPPGEWRRATLMIRPEAVQVIACDEPAAQSSPPFGADTVALGAV